MENKTMTLAEISELTGKGATSIRRWATSTKMANILTKMANAKKTKEPAEFTLDETISIIRAGGHDTLANLLLQNSKGEPEKISGSSLTSKDIELISVIVSQTVSQTISATIQHLDSRMGRIESRIEDRQALLPPPEIAPRDHINKLVREYANRTGLVHSIVWGYIYTEFKYTYKMDVKRLASNRDMAIIEYIETEGMIEQLLAVTMKFCAEEK